MFETLGRLSRARSVLLLLVFVATPALAQKRETSSNSEIDAFYSAHPTLIWFNDSLPSDAAKEIPPILRRAKLDGLADGPILATQVELAIQSAARFPSLAPQMDRIISAAWVRFVEAIEQPMPGFEYADERMQPKIENAIQILRRISENRLDLREHVLNFSSINPLYSSLRDAVLNESSLTGSEAPAATFANLARTRILLPDGKAIIVDARAGKLYMFERGKIVDSMKVVAGKPDTPTPLIASTIYYATLNPYWNVPRELVQHLIAPRVLVQGVSYLKAHNYEVVSKYGPAASVLSAASIDWKAVADGSVQVFLRQLPGPANSMGKIKFAFSNSGDIYLHDTPNKEVFGREERLLSNGCIRLEDAQRLGRWLLGREPTTNSKSPDEHVLLPIGVPVYVTYLTMRSAQGKVKFIGDAYGKDPEDDGPTLPSKMIR